MRRVARKILDEALALPEGQRLHLASELLASVEGPGDPDWDAAWLAELDHRTSAADRGRARRENWQVVRARIVKRLARR